VSGYRCFRRRGPGRKAWAPRVFVRRPLSREQRQELVARLRQRGLSLRRIAELLGVDTKTVYNDLNSILENSKIENPYRIQRTDGKTYPARQRTEAERM